MPELPEVETMRRGVLPIVGRRIASVRRTPCPRKPIRITPRIDRFNRRAAGQTIVAVDRAGKRVVLRLESDDRIVIEPRMTGLVLLTDPPSREHLRLEVSLAPPGKPKSLLFWDRRGLGTVRLLSPRAYRAALGPEVLGPDALEVTPELLRDRLATSRRPIKVALLDQRALAGIGNLYASEILHLARIHPALRCTRMRAGDWPVLCEAIEQILQEAIRYEGSTLSDGTYRNAQNNAGRYQNHHRVYSLAGTTCPTCQGPSIIRIVQQQRSTFFCPSCQPR